MKAMMLTGIRQIEMRQVPDPLLHSDTDVLVRMKVVGVCGSDVHYYTTGRIGSQVVQYPFTVGHECAGVVEGAGPGVTRVAAGGRVAVEPAMSCGQCDQCKAGRPHTCRKLRFLGCPGQADGCLCDRIVMPQECCYPIPDTMTFQQAAVSEPLSIGLYGVRQSVPMPGARIGILGVGPIGLSVLLPARHLGAQRIYVTDRVDRRLEVARAAGADWAANVDHEDVVAAVTDQEPLGLDAVFECCGQQDAVDQALQLLKPGGKLMLIGIPQVDRLCFVPDWMRRKEVCIQNVRRQNHCVQPALDMIARAEIDVDFMVTHHFGLDECKAAFDLVDQYADGVVKAMIEL